MTFGSGTLAEVASVVSGALSEKNISVVVVGGSAITSHVPQIYTSLDIDLAVVSHDDSKAVEKVLAAIGFRRRGRDFAHPATHITIDLVANDPIVEDVEIREFATITTLLGEYKTLHLPDAIADRVSAFVHWSDGESLDVAQRAARATKTWLTLDQINAALLMLKPEGHAARARFQLARTLLEQELISGK